jgi:hypothetical protein
MRDLRPERDARPWLPVSTAAPGLVLNEYDIPLAGLVRQNETTNLYVCLVGELEPLNIWAYAPLRESEVAELVSLTELPLSAAIDRMLLNRMLVVALAHELRLGDWIRIDSGMEGPIALAARFIEAVADPAG